MQKQSKAKEEKNKPEMKEDIHWIEDIPHVHIDDSM